MKTYRIMAGALLVLLSAGQVKAQSLEDILKQKIDKVVKQVTVLQAEDLMGNWHFKGSACQFKSDDLLQKAGGIALAEGMEKKLDEVYAKAGFSAEKFSYTFNRDSTFTSQSGKRKLKGTYSYDAANGILTLKYYSLLSSEVRVVKKGEYISLLFDADKLLKLITLLSNYSKNAVLQNIGQVAGQYNGMLLGFELSK